MSGDSPRRPSGGGGVCSRGGHAMPSIVPPQVVSDRSILDSAIGFINDVTLSHQPHTDSKDTITWARFESAADISDPRFGEDWELEGNVAPPLLLILGYGLGVQVWAIPANGEAVEVLSWRHGVVTSLRVLPTPSSCSNGSSYDENGRADEHSDAFAEKRPLIAMVDGTAGSSSGGQAQFSSVNFVSLRTGMQVKTIKFKNPVLDILANRSSIVITLHERIAVFDARTLEDRLSITTCYPSPGINPNPVALGPRWLAYAENKLLHSKRSGGGCDGDGVASYTATVLNAAKSFGKGLRELGEQVAAGLTGTTGSAASSKSSSFDSGCGPDAKQPGIVTIMDIKNPLKEYGGTPTGSSSTQSGCDPIVAHFIAHLDAVVALEFDNSGMLLVTADRRGHDFHIFRIQPHPVGASLAAVHHLYVLHRGDTSAKVQNIAFSLDSRWVAVSTLRGTTHVFPITPYGGPMGVRTHTSLHVVNKLSRFHRSAGLSAEGRSSSPISHSESTTFMQSLQPYHNPTLPSYPRPTIVLPLAQLRQPMALGSPPGTAGLSGVTGVSGKIGGGSAGSGSGSQRQRLSSLSDDSGKPLSVCAIFAKSRSWLLEPPNATREAPHRIQRKAVDSLFVMAGHGALIQYDLDTKLASNVAKEKICDDTPIELEVEAKAQWNLGRRKDGSQEVMPPLMLDNWLIKDRNSCMLMDTSRQYDDNDDRGDSWLSQVEIITHAGPHRRLWMGPQFVFKTYNTPSGSNLTHVDVEAVEIGISKANATSAAAAAPNTTALSRLERSSPLNMPLSMASHGHSAVPVLIESGSYSSIEQSPKLMDRFRHEHLNSDYSVAHGDSRLKEDLADAMRETPSSALKDTGRLPPDATSSSENVPFYDALAEHYDDDDQAAFEVPSSVAHSVSASNRSSSVAALASALPNIFSYDTVGFESADVYTANAAKKSPTPSALSSIEKVVNPLGTVTTVTACMTADVKTDMLDEVVSQLAAEECVIHENCDESLFRPVVAIFCDKNAEQVLSEEELRLKQEQNKPPEVISNKLIVPVIDKAVDDEISKKQEQRKCGVSAIRKTKDRAPEVAKVAQEKADRKLIVEKEEQAKKSEKVVEPPKVAEKKKPSKKDVPKDEFSEEEEVISFKRMTPQKEDKKKSSNEVIVEEKPSKKSPPPEPKKKEKFQFKEVEVIKVEMLPTTSKSTEKASTDKSKSLTTEKDVKVASKKAGSSGIKLESLNVGDLVSSLIDVDDDIKVEQPPIVEASIAVALAPPIDTPPTAKLSKKMKKKQNKSGSNSESEEIVEVAKEPQKKSTEEIKEKQSKETPITLPCDDEIADLADSLLESKGLVSETMFVSLEAKTTAEKPKKVTIEEDCVKTDESKAKQSEQTKPKKPVKESKASAEQEPKEVEPKIEKKSESKDAESDTKSSDKVEQKKTVPRKDSLEKSKEESKVERSEKIKTTELVEESIDKTIKRKKSIEELQKPMKIAESLASKQSENAEKENLEKSAEGTKKSVTESKRTLESDKEPLNIRKVDNTRNSKEEEQSTKSNEGSIDKFKKPEGSINSKKPAPMVRKMSDEKIKPPVESVKKPEAEDLKKLSAGVSKKTEETKESKEDTQKSSIASKKITEETKKPSDSLKDISEGPKKSSDDSKKPTDVSKKSTEESLKSIGDLKKKPSEVKNSTEELKKPQESPKKVIASTLPTEEPKKLSGPSCKDVEESKKSFSETSKKANISETKKPDALKSSDIDCKKNIEADVKKNANKTEETSGIDVKPKVSPKSKNIETNPKELKMDKTIAEQTTNVKTTKDTTEDATTKESIKKDNQDIVADKKTPPPVAATAEKADNGSQPKSPKKSTIKLSHDLMPFGMTAAKAQPTIETKSKESPIGSPKVITEQPLKSKNSPQMLQLQQDSSPKKAAKEKPSTISPPLPPVTSAWKNLSGAEMISKKLDFGGDEKAAAYPSLSKQTKSKSQVSEKLLPDLPSPLKTPEKKKLKEPLMDTTGNLKDFPVLKPLESLPPLPSLEPLEVVSTTEQKASKEESLINFESPLLENPALERKITPPPRGFTEQNLIFALCGSLHYDYEQQAKTLDSPTHSVTRSSSAMGEQSTADYKSLTENDEQYISFDQSSQETNTTNTATTNEKLTSSTNSSACEEIIIVKEKKMTKKQKRKKQQMEIERQKSHSGAASTSGAGNTTETDVDEELRPLIGMSDSQSEALLPPEDQHDGVTLLMEEDTGYVRKLPLTITTTATDSESPMPATTSDDNCFIVPALNQNATPNKVKTKKLEHKINLMAAIEAATSSSTSSAEESGLEASISTNNNGSRALDLDPALVSSPSAAQPLITLPGVGGTIPAAAATAYPSIQQGGSKKKTKRRKR